MLTKTIVDENFSPIETQNLIDLQSELAKAGQTVDELWAEGQEARKDHIRAGQAKERAKYTGLHVAYRIIAAVWNNDEEMIALRNLIGADSPLHHNAELLNTIIRLSLGVNGKYASKLATVARFALSQEKHVSPAELEMFIKTNGKVNGCVRAFRQLHGSREEQDTGGQRPKATASTSHASHQGKDEAFDERGPTVGSLTTRTVVDSRARRTSKFTIRSSVLTDELNALKSSSHKKDMYARLTVRVRRGTFTAFGLKRIANRYTVRRPTHKKRTKP